MVSIRPKHISAGGNRSSNAADWKADILAFGSGNNVAAWSPSSRRGISQLLRGHTDVVNAVRIHVDGDTQDSACIISGSADKTVRLWHRQSDGGFTPGLVIPVSASVNTLSYAASNQLLVVGTADAVLSVYRLDGSSVGSSPVIVTRDNGNCLLAVAGTTTIVQLYLESKGQFTLAATLSGHEGWMRSLDFTRETFQSGSDLLLASASQDRYVRLWRLHRGKELPSASTASQDPTLGVLAKSLSNKPHYLGKDENLHSVTFEALLIGHEDWIYNARWRESPGTINTPELLTASADSSISIWKREVDSGYWICQSRLGEISAQKGSTTATGSAGGFWIGVWSPDGLDLACLARTGSWKVWTYDKTTTSWQQRFGIGGHTKAVKSIAWAADGSYLLSTSSDQTTRLLAPWKSDKDETWHELARPQIHGYDLNCISTLGTPRFVSGADEKLLRVFNKPRSTALLLDKLGNTSSNLADLPEIANIPVLGLSNKAVTNEDETETNGSQEKDTTEAESETVPEQDTSGPPFEDALGRYTLWPEIEKLYGHGNEICAVAATSRGDLIATACRASSVDHAVIRLYETKNWREVKPALVSHSLTVTSLNFSHDDRRLLSVGRDRVWTVFERAAQDDGEWKVRQRMEKGHSRMILDCAWLPIDCGGDVFATAGRDKCVKVWSSPAAGVVEEEVKYVCVLTIPLVSPVTAIALTAVVDQSEPRNALLACGTEDGGLSIFELNVSEWAVASQSALDVAEAPASAVNALRWKPRENSDSKVLACASDDHSVRLYDVAK